jgi:hypothetical protein
MTILLNVLVILGLVVAIAAAREVWPAGPWLGFGMGLAYVAGAYMQARESEARR